jgi:hypothetical protein
MHMPELCRTAQLTELLLLLLLLLTGADSTGRDREAQQHASKSFPNA